ncbi:unnamed protein product [Parajaminaea phylloscopi]
MLYTNPSPRRLRGSTSKISGAAAPPPLILFRTAAGSRRKEPRERRRSGSSDKREKVSGRGARPTSCSLEAGQAALIHSFRSTPYSQRAVRYQFGLLHKGVRTQMAKGKAAEAPKPTAVIEEGGLRHRSQARGLLNTSNLPALQNLLKRDPEAYTDEFKQQWNHYQSLRAIYAANIGATDAFGAAALGTDVASAGVTGNKMAKEHEDRFRELLAFVTQLVPSYPVITAGFPKDLSELLIKHHASLSPDLRHSAVRSIVLLHNKDVIDSEEMLRTLFPLLSITTSSVLRSLIQSTILTDIKNANAKSKNHRLNRVVQGLLFGVIEDGMKEADGFHSAARKKGAEPKGKSQALWSVRLAADLWRKNIWNDAKTVSLLALACFHPHPKVQSSAIRFFLNDLHHAEDGAEVSDSDSEDEPVIPDMSKLQHQRKINKKTRSQDRKVQKMAALAKKRNKEKAAKAEQGAANFAALYLLNDPQTFGEKLFDNLSKGDKRHPIEVKVRLMQLLSRVMGAHKLCVLSFYSYIVKYLAPHQLHVTLILVSLAQSVHEQTPPDVLTPVIRKISDAFVHPGVGPEVVAAGINAVREIARRQPWCMEETLLEDLIGYRKSKDKGVAAASRSLLQLYRDVNPAMLPRKERGKSGSLALQAGQGPRAYGVAEAGVQGIQGLELLEQHLEEEKAKRAEEGSDAEDEDEAAWKQWELESDSDGESDDSGGWINVDSDGDSDFDVDYSDSDNEGKTGESEGGDKAKLPAKERAALRREKRRRERQRARRKADGKDDDDDDDSSEGSDDGEAEDDDAQDGKSAKAATAATAEAVENEAAKVSQLATTRILTPADFAKLNELRLAAAEAAAATGGRSGAAAKRELAELQSRKRTTAATGAREDDLAFVDEYDILGPRKKAKADYEERMASIAKGREDREKFGSKKGKKLQDKKSSTTNEQKAKGKNFGMVSKSWSVRSKKRTSLRDKSKALKKHKEKQAKMKGKH